MIGGAWTEWLAYFALCIGLLAAFHAKARAHTSFYAIVVIPAATFIIVLISQIVMRGVYKFFLLTPLLWFCISMGLGFLYFSVVKRLR